MGTIFLLFIVYFLICVWCYEFINNEKNDKYDRGAIKVILICFGFPITLFLFLLGIMIALR